MEALKFINTHPDWEERLSKPPYCITTKHHGDYVLLKYIQFASDFSMPIVRESRGAIFFKNSDGVYDCVNRSFDKFGNYGESYATDIDWESAVVEEKVDGSLIRLWHHTNEWHVSTNGTIDAYQAQVGHSGLTFGDLFDQAIGIHKHEFLNSLDKNTVYMFELVSPKSTVTIYYPETKLYYLGQRDMTTMKESKDVSKYMTVYGIKYPKVYELKTLNDCLEYVKMMTKDEEGFVVRDRNFNRIKLKSPEYLISFHMKNNGAITTKRIIEMIKNEQIDDFLAYRPEYSEEVQLVLDRIKDVCDKLTCEWEIVSIWADKERRIFAMAIKTLKYKDWCFAKYDNNVLTPIEYIMFQTTAQIQKLICDK